MIRSIPTHVDRGFVDVILHDGVPSGCRTVNGGKYSVLDEISVWQPLGRGGGHGVRVGGSGDLVMRVSKAGMGTAAKAIAVSLVP